MDKPVTMKTYPAPVLTDVGSIMSVIIPIMRDHEKRIGEQVKLLDYLRAVPTLYYDGWEINISLRYVGEN